MLFHRIAMVAAVASFIGSTAAIPGGPPEVVRDLGPNKPGRSALVHEYNPFTEKQHNKHNNKHKHEEKKASVVGESPQPCEGEMCRGKMPKPEVIQDLGPTPWEKKQQKLKKAAEANTP